MTEPDWLTTARREGRILSETSATGPPLPTASTSARGASARTCTAPARTSSRTSSRPSPAAGAPGRSRVVIVVELPLRLTSEANAGGRLGAKLARKGAVKAAVAAALPQLAEAIPLPVRVTLTRLALRPLDDDNLAHAFKAVRDQVAAWLGVDDADPRVRFRYRQCAGWSPAVRIRVQSIDPGAA